jgi:uncharacterized protein (UPF0335 family)
MTEVHSNTNLQLKAITERLNRLEDEKKERADDIGEVYAEAKSAGYNVKALRVVIRKQRADAKAAAELQAEVEVMMAALGMLS